MTWFNTKKSIHNYVKATLENEAKIAIKETESALIINNHLVYYCEEKKALQTKPTGIINDTRPSSPKFAENYIKRFYYMLAYTKMHNID